MIYVTVGKHSQAFDRLVRKIDEIAPSLGEEVVMQTGVSAYMPVNARYFSSIFFREAEQFIQQARLVVSHAGAGTIMLARKHSIPLIIVPRRKRFNEHFTDHQMELCQVLSEEKRENLYVVYDLDRIEETIRHVLDCGKAPVSFNSNGRDKILHEIKIFLNGNI